MSTIARIRWGLSLLSLVIGTVALLHIPTEHQASMMTRRSDEQVIALVTDPARTPHLSASWRTQYDQLAVCLESMNSVLAMFLPGPRQADLAAGCERMADDVLHGAPTFGLAHLVKFATAEHQGRMAADQLARAADLARVEPSEISLRVKLAISHAPDFGPVLAKVFADDAALMAKTYWGRAELAPLYIDTPAARPAITAAVETADARSQQQFLWAVQNEQKARAAALAEAQASEEAAP